MSKSVIKRKIKPDTRGSETGVPKGGISLLIPSSCREGFTNDVCGLPSNVAGCWRYRQVFANASVPEKGIPPIPIEDIAEPLIAWLVFESTVDGEMKPPQMLKFKPEFDLAHHQALFGFTKEGLNGFRQQSGAACYPNYAEYNRAAEGAQSYVKDWLDESGMDTGLANCFGQDTFKIQRITNLELNIDLQLSLSDVIRSYLNHNQRCRFRRLPSGRAIGITFCKASVELSKTFVEDKDNRGSNRDLLSSSVISFSYVDPDVLAIKKLPEWTIGRFDADVEQNDHLKSLSDGYFVPVMARRFKEHEEETTVNFASSLSRYGRRSVLPSETGKSFLRFSIGEIACYLLHWMLLRIFANNSGVNIDFIRQFDKWRKLLNKADRSHTREFSRLLMMPVLLAFDGNVFAEEILSLSNTKERFGIISSPTPFADVLRVIGLDVRADSAWTFSVMNFLKAFFASSDSGHGFQVLPMYKPLGWRESSLLTKNKNNNQARIEAVIACMAEASGLSTGSNGTREAIAELKRHSERSVFPIADVLAGLPRHGKPLTHYYVFPLWEETIEDRFGHEWRGPVIFAHVFTTSRGSRPVDELSDKSVLEIGEALQGILLPAGAAIAHEFYKKMLSQSSAWTHARAWAHEVKNYTSPIIDDLGGPILEKYKNVLSENALQTLEGSRRGVLILNAVSKAVQLSLNSRVDPKDVKDGDRLIRLSPVDGREIVEMSLQYLLNYRHQFLETGSVQKYTIGWSPRITADEALTRLSQMIGTSSGDTSKIDSEKEVVTHGSVIGVLALLREVIWNIRNEAPARTADGVPVVNLSYEFLSNDHVLALIIQQQQIETNEGSDSVETSPGIRFANVLFGSKGARFGSINEMVRGTPVKQSEKQFLITRKVAIEFQMSESIAERSNTS